MSLARKLFATPARIWMNWPLWGGLLAMLLLAKHVWVLFAPTEHAIPATAITTNSVQTEQLFGMVNASTSSASLSSIRPIGIFAHSTRGFAVMLTESGQIGVGLGEQVVPGVRLIETHADYVVLERNGIRQRVDLNTPPAATDNITTASSSVRIMTATTADRQMLDRLTPEQLLLIQQGNSSRGRP